MTILEKFALIQSEKATSFFARMSKLHLAKKRRTVGIAEIIATLLLILIAVAAAVIVYSYVIGFIGNATASSGSPPSLISVDNFCASASTHCSGGNGYYVVIRNVGSNQILSGTPELYFTDQASGQSAAIPCVIPGPANPGSVYYCGGFLPAGFPQSSLVSLKVVDPDGGATTSSTRVLP